MGCGGCVCERGGEEGRRVESACVRMMWIVFKMTQIRVLGCCVVKPDTVMPMHSDTVMPMHSDTVMPMHSSAAGLHAWNVCSAHTRVYTHARTRTFA